MAQARIASALAEIRAGQWDALHDGRNPFVAHAFLSGLEQHGCLRGEWGWTPHHLTLWEGDQLVAAAPGYLKTNSHGEFVFDHAWAHAYARHGLAYYPKWLCAVPYTPVTGPRLLAKTTRHRRALLQAMVELCGRESWSSAHINFHALSETHAFEGLSLASGATVGWLSRIDVQYIWRNTSGWADFAAFLAALDHRHRKNIRQERAKVMRAGVAFRIVHGDEATDAELATMHGFYRRTFAEYGNYPALTLDFLHHLARTMPRALVLILAERITANGKQAVAGALCLRGADTLYGRYWGAREQIHGLHFETCYYQGIDYCLRNGLTRFEPGAQGEHKLARGFLPALVRSRHWIAHEGFREVLGHWCEEETASVHRYAANLMLHSPFKHA
ncbi:GNAT family N-acetyltransferase [Lysobacter niabensis]|uniref:GNAT family N-acetyltransferase n=1 Tax=Agrilutibacter niabensis TaxID=380628 RepID=UPI00360B5383